MNPKRLGLNGSKASGRIDHPLEKVVEEGHEPIE